MDVSSLFNSVMGDGPNPNKVRASDWNELVDALALAPAYNVAEIITGAWTFSSTVLFSGASNIGDGTSNNPVVIYAEDAVRVGIGDPQLVIQQVAGAYAQIYTSNARPLYFGTAANLRWSIDATGHFLATGAYNIGDGAGSSPVNIYAENNLISAGGVIGGRIYGHPGAATATMHSPTDGIWQMANNAETGFTRLIFGTNDASGFAWVKTGAGAQFATGNGSAGTFLEGIEIADPAAPSANSGRLYFKDNGSGKSQLAIRFATGAVQIVATEP